MKTVVLKPMSKILNVIFNLESGFDKCINFYNSVSLSDLLKMFTKT